MLNKIIYLANDLASISFNFDTDDTVIPSVILHNGKSYTELLFQIYNPDYSGQQFNFCLCFDLSNPALINNATNEFIENEQPFLQIIFSKNYRLSFGKPDIVLLVSPGTLNATNEFMKPVERCLAAQGYDTINKILVSSDFNEEQTFTGGIILAGNSELKNETVPKYYSLLSKTNFYNNYIGCINLLPRELTAMKNGLQASENHFKENFPLRYEMMINQITLFAKSEKLMYDLENAKKQIHNKDTYLEIFISQDQANQINKFYHYEYEILPFWYKQAGQIIKVLTGKRTFRSLFNKNVKKYKE